MYKQLRILLKCAKNWIMYRSFFISAADKALGRLQVTTDNVNYIVTIFYHTNTDR